MTNYAKFQVSGGATVWYVINYRKGEKNSYIETYIELTSIDLYKSDEEVQNFLMIYCIYSYTIILLYNDSKLQYLVVTIALKHVLKCEWHMFYLWS